MIPLRLRETVAVIALMAAVPALAQTPPPRPPLPSAGPTAGQQQQQQQESVNPPGRVGAVAYMLGTVSFHDDQQDGWSPAVLNYPVGTGDALWTEPDGRVEIVVGGSRLRLQGASELDVVEISDNVTRYSLARGRVDLRVTGYTTNQPIQIVTPRGNIDLLANGDYVVEAGTTDDPTRIGVRAGSARLIATNGSALAVPAGQIGLITGSPDTPNFQVVNETPPALPQEWVARDRTYVTAVNRTYTAPGVTAIEELDQYGTWSTVATYGRVWTPRDVPGDWQPYHYGHWAWVAPWGWTWIDDQPWGFAPSHYGRWVHTNRWYWIPPVATSRVIYAPAVVGYLDPISFNPLGTALATAAAVAWFALGPDDVYVPYYTRDRYYIRELNRSNIRDQRLIDARLDWLERRDANRDRDFDPRFNSPNRRFASVVRQEDFVRSREVRNASLRVSQDELARSRIAAVAAPPVRERTAADQPGRPGQPQPQARDRDNRLPAGATVARSAVGDVPVIGKPTEQERRTAPGPELRRPTGDRAATRTPDRERNARPELPQKTDRTVSAPPGPQRGPGRTEEQQRQGTPGAAVTPTQPQATPPTKPGTQPEQGNRQERDNERGRTGDKATPPEKPAGQQPPAAGRTPPLPEREREAAPGQQRPAQPQAQQPPKLPEPQRAQEPPKQPAAPQAQQPKQPEPPQRAQEPPKAQGPQRDGQVQPRHNEPPVQREREAQPQPQRERPVQPAQRAPEPRQERPPQIAQPPRAEPQRAEPQRSEPQHQAPQRQEQQQRQEKGQDERGK